MAQIKCHCKIPYCYYTDYPRRLQHDDYWWCDTEDFCPFGGYKEPDDATVVNPTCFYCVHHNEEFEKTVKNYTYNDEELKIGRKTYHVDEIVYLEIDGRVLIDEEQEAGGE